MIEGRVNASARKIVSGCLARTSAIIHSQNANGFVCGLSTRNTVTPRSIHSSTTSRSSSQSARACGPKKLKLTMS